MMRAALLRVEWMRSVRRGIGENMQIVDEQFMLAVDLLVGVSAHSKTCCYFSTVTKACCRCMEDIITGALKLRGVSNVAKLIREAIASHEKHQKASGALGDGCSGGYAVNPPSIVRLAPVTKPASGPAR